MEIDDSEEGLRKRFTIWVGAICVGTWIHFAGGYYKMGEILSFPEYTKDWNNDGVIDAPGSWDIVEGTGLSNAFLPCHASRFDTVHCSCSSRDC